MQDREQNLQEIWAFTLGIAEIISIYKNQYVHGVLVAQNKVSSERHYELDLLDKTRPEKNNLQGHAVMNQKSNLSTVISHASIISIFSRPMLYCPGGLQQWTTRRQPNLSNPWFTLTFKIK